MATWISFDLDWATGDCRGGIAHKCVKRCFGCPGENIGRGNGNSPFYPQDTEEYFTAMRDWLLSLSIKKVVLRDNHGEIGRFLRRGDKVLNFDDHSDDEEIDGFPFVCYNWVSYARNRSIEVEQCKGLEFENIQGPVNLFIAVSRPYTNTSLDGHLFRLLMDLERPVNFNGGA